MKKVKLRKIKKDIEYIDNPEADRIYWADPRLFTVSQCYPRTGKYSDPLRRIKSLEKNILAFNFRFPVLSDMNFEIVAGYRRLSIAKKHKIKLLVLFRKYSSIVEKIKDSYLNNEHHYLDRNETFALTKMLLEDNVGLDDIKLLYGVTWKYWDPLGIKSQDELKKVELTKLVSAIYHEDKICEACKEGNLKIKTIWFNFPKMKKYTVIEIGSNSILIRGNIRTSSKKLVFDYICDNCGEYLRRKNQKLY